MTRGSTVGGRYRPVVETLRRAGSETPEAEARLLLGGLFSLPCAEVSVSEHALDPDEEELLDDALRRRLAHEPVQYILSKAYFYDLELEVTPAVLIPRPETEILVERAVKMLPEHGKLLDLGTGSGAIALAAAHARPDVQVTALDISQTALEVAERNRARLGCANVEFELSDLCSALAPDERFDVAVANLPYVPEGDRPLLAPEVAEHEPETALFVPGNGAALMLRAIRELAPHLVPGGEAIFELDPRQAPEICRAFAAAGFIDIATLRDLVGKERFVTGRLEA